MSKKLKTIDKTPVAKVKAEANAKAGQTEQPEKQPAPPHPIITEFLGKQVSFRYNDTDKVVEKFFGFVFKGVFDGWAWFVSPTNVTCFVRWERIGWMGAAEIMLPAGTDNVVSLDLMRK